MVRASDSLLKKLNPVILIVLKYRWVYRKMYFNNSNTCMSVTEPDKSPYWMYKVDNDYKILPVDRYLGKKISFRQELSKVYALNGAVYIAGTDWLLKEKSFMSKETMAFIMPKERSIDINSELDLKIVNAFYWD